jgi:hypothetical protein
MWKMSLLALVILGQTIMVTGPDQFNPSQEVTLVPRPKTVQWLAGEPFDLTMLSVAIVTGNRATEPEQYAAQFFQERVQKRFGLSWSIVGESSVPAGAQLVILPGQRSTNDWLNQLCTDNSIDLSPSSPGHDGYVIANVQSGTRQVVLVGGSNPRGVVYGMDTLFQCVVQWSGKAVMARGTVRDWPTVPWRGRPQTGLDNFFREGEWDTYATARINFTDLRNSIYAFEPGDDLDEVKIAAIVQDAHRRGILVFGSVNCGIPVSKHALAIGTFTEFINLGVDGLWMSFDDNGWGDNPVSLVTQVVNLANANGISGAQLAVTPSKGGYQNIDDPDNQPVMNIAGMKNALWFFTRVPCQADYQTAQSMGLLTKPSWWHNWTRPHSGFTHVSSSSLRQDGVRSYLPVPAMCEGWHSPGYEILAEGGQYCQASMPWGGNGWPQYYIVPVIGWWSWNPEGHDFTEVRSRIYDIVFGTAQVSQAMEFDDKHNQARMLFRYGGNVSDAEALCPARLKDEADRAQAQALFDNMEAVLDGMEENARQDTMLVSVNVLNEWYLTAMRGELETGRIAAGLSYPEYWWNDHQRALLNALYDGDTGTANTLASSVRSKVYADVDEIGTRLSHLQYVSGYRTWWRNRAALDAAGWQSLVNQRKTNLSYWINEYGKVSDPDLGKETTANMLSGINSPPFMEYGIGRWNIMNRLLAKVVPAEREMFWGELMGGVYRSGDRTAAVFTIPQKIYANAGGFAELPIRLPMLGNRERLSLMIYMSSVNKIDFAWDLKPYRWTNRRFVRLLWEDRVLWEADAGVQRNRGGWFWANLPPFPDGVDEIPLRLRIEDDDFLENNNNIVFVGPLWLLERSGY